jgi:tetratricopeptide (TPR) repeat protein
MRKQLKAVVIAMLVMQVAGCSILTESGLTPDRLLGKVDKQGQAADNTKGTQRSEAKVANPPARTLRFDGHEIVLGETEHEVIDTARLVGMLGPLIEKQKFQTAANLIARYRETGERLLLERWATGADNEVVQLVADVLSRRSPQSEANWKSLLAIARQQKTQAVQYQAHRNSFAEELKTSEPSNETAEALLAAALKVQHPLVRIDAFRLLGLRELVAGRHAWAESQFRQGIEQAMATGGHRIAADLWLMVAESARRGNQGAATSQAWNNALDLHLTTYRADEPVDIGFWQLADKTRPALFEWPEEVGQLLASHLAATGCSTESPEMVLWTTVAQAQYDRGEFQTALVNFKRAETLSREPNVKWLRIAQARCLAGMGQAPAAAAILRCPQPPWQPWGRLKFKLAPINRVPSCFTSLYRRHRRTIGQGSLKRWLIWP